MYSIKSKIIIIACLLLCFWGGNASDVELFRSRLVSWLQDKEASESYQTQKDYEYQCVQMLGRIFDEYLKCDDPNDLSRLVKSLDTQALQVKLRMLIFQDLKKRDPEARKRIVTAIMNFSTSENKYSLINSRIATDHDPEAYGEEIQKFIVAEIPTGNLKMQGFLLLSPERKKQLLPYLLDLTARLYGDREQPRLKLSIIAAMLLGYDGHEEGVDALLHFSQDLNINNLIDSYVPPAMAATGNPKLLRELGKFVLTRKERKWYGDDCMPQQSSLAFHAAASLSAVVDGFPKISFLKYFTEEQERQCEEFVVAHPGDLPVKKNYSIWDFPLMTEGLWW